MKRQLLRSLKCFGFHEFKISRVEWTETTPETRNQNHTEIVRHASPAQPRPRTVPQLLTAKDLEARLKVDAKTIYSWVRRGLIPYVRIQSAVRFREHEIADWLEGNSFHLGHRP